jgi:hypothetical protein
MSSSETVSALTSGRVESLKALDSLMRRAIARETVKNFIILDLNKINYTFFYEATAENNRISHLRGFGVLGV